MSIPEIRGRTSVAVTSRPLFLEQLGEGLPGVRGVLEELQSNLLGQLADVVGLYVYGSLVLGDFDPEESDLDLLAALSREVGDTHLRALRRLHNQFVRAHPDWDERVEVACVSLVGIRTFKSQPSTVAIVSPGEPLHLKQVGREWLIDYHLVREHGITLHGPPPETLFDDISTEEFQNAIRDHLQSWREPLPPRPTFRSLRYAVLTMCRGLYALRHGKHSSKRQAGLWAQRAFPEWAHLIERMLASRNTDAATEADRRETAHFIEFALRTASVT
jgi:hypothetical protein